MDATPDSMGPRDFARLLADRYGLRISHQGLSKAGYLPKDAAGRIIVTEAILELERRGRLRIAQETAGGSDAEPTLGLDAPAPLPSVAPSPESAAPLAGRPRTAGSLGYEQMLTERLKRRKLEIEVEEKEGRLLRTDDVAEAMSAGGRKIGEKLDAIPRLAERLVSVAKTGDVEAVRGLLRGEIRAIREGIAEILNSAAAAAADDQGGHGEPDDSDAEGEG